ncbi:MAG: hypothetical protein AAEC86_11130 [Pseudohongiellaceae bacterium]
MFASAYVEFVAAAGRVDRDRVRDPEPGTSLEHYRVFAGRVVDIIDPVPIRHWFTHDLPFEPQPRPGSPAALGKRCATGIDVSGLQASHAQRQERYDHEDSDNQQASFQRTYHLNSPHGVQ